MNAFILSDIYQGLSASFEVEITQSSFDQFILLSGDASPLHTDQEFARERGFISTPVHGLLTAAFYSQLVGIHLPGRNGYSQEYKIAFTKPVYVGDRLSVYGEVEFINHTCKQITINAHITNAEGIQVSRAHIKAGFFCDRASS